MPEILSRQIKQLTAYSAHFELIQKLSSFHEYSQNILTLYHLSQRVCCQQIKTLKASCCHLATNREQDDDRRQMSQGYIHLSVNNTHTYNNKANKENVIIPFTCVLQDDDNISTAVV